jgi:hypothetical protein
MRMSRPVAVGLLVGILTACGSASPPGSTSSSHPTTPTSSPSSSAPPSTSTTLVSAPIDWADPSVIVTLGDGWTVQACEGEAPLLCVSRNGSHIGLVEANEYPLDSFEGTNPKDPGGSLILIAEDFIDSMAADRAAGCGVGYRLDPHMTSPVTVGGQPGIRFGYTGVMADGSPSERIAQFGTIVGDEVLLLTAAAYDDGGCPGRDELATFSSADLAAFEPFLEAVVLSSPLPRGMG